MHRVWSRSIYVTWADTGRWYHFDVLREVEQWLSYPETNHGFLVTAIDSTKTQLALLTARDDYERRYVRIPGRYIKAFYHVSNKKNCGKFILSELRQISTNLVTFGRYIHI